MNVLVVDDSVSVRKALERILSTRNLTVVATGSAEEALERLSDSAPALVIADVVMPGMDGFALCSRLKADPDYRRVPVLLISGIVDREVARRAAEVGAADIVKKPFTPEDLFPKIEKVLAAPAPQPTPTVVPAAEPVVQAAAPDGAGADSREWGELLQPLLANGAVEAALLADAHGTSLAQVGRGLSDGDTLAVYSRTLASISAALGDNVGVPELGSLQLDFQGKSLLIARTPTRGTLLLRVKDASSVGVARYLVRRVLEADVFKEPPVLAS